jgi:hypothetical protein
MSATMSGDTPLGKLFSKKARFLSSTIPDQNPCKYWAPRREEILAESGEKRRKKRPKRRNLRPFQAFQNLLYLVPQEQQKDVKGVTTR